MKVENVHYATHLSQYHFEDERCGEFHPGDYYIRSLKAAAELGYSEEAKKLYEELGIKYTEVQAKLCELIMNPKEDPDEPEDLEGIKEQREAGPRRLLKEIPDDYYERFMGSFIGRGVGCTLGAALEFDSVEQMENWARYCGQEYPLTDYWKRVRKPYEARYITGNRNDLTKGTMQYCPVDDDTGYSLLGLLTLEEFGPEFTHEDMAKLWSRVITVKSPENGSWGIYWGERIFLENYLSGMPAEKAGFYNNPHVQSVAAWTRADTYGYVCPGWPERAAELAYRDASLNHRRNGVYATMFMAAAVSAAFAVNDPVEALKIALTEIPRNSMLAEAVRWAFKVAPDIHNYKDAVAAVNGRYAGMFEGNAINNLLYVVFGILIGGKDFTKVIGETVAMGFDNDCTGATSASIVGAVIKLDNIPKHWYECFQGRLQNCFLESPEFITFEELEKRYLKQAKKIFSERNL